MSGIRSKCQCASDRITAAIVGFGAVAKNAHLPWYFKRSDVELVAVVEPTAAGRSLARCVVPDVQVFEDVGSLLQSVDVDFLDIASPPAAHAEALLKAATAGIAVFCEKPFVTDWHSFQQIENARPQPAPVIACCHNWYFAPPIRRALGLIESGQLGDVNSVYFETRRPRPAEGARHWKPEWRRTMSNGGGIIADLGYHGMYLASRMIERPLLAVRTATPVKDSTCDGAELAASVQLDYGNNRTAELNLSWQDVMRCTKIRVTGSNACLSIDGDTLRLYDSKRCLPPEKYESVTADSWHASWTSKSLDQFMTSLYSREGESCWRDIRRSMSALSAAYASARSGVIEAAFIPL
jgi:predicted dehydrogenase